MKTLLLILVLLSAIIGSSVFAQTQQWATTYGGGNDEALSKTVMDNSGNVYITGQATNINVTYYYEYLAKYNSAGIFQWQRFFTSPYSNLVNNRGSNSYTSALDNSGNICIAGSTDSTFGNYKGFIMKYSPAGDSIWGKYAGINDTLGYVEWYSMKIDNSGNVYVAGFNFKQSTSYRAFIIAKYNSAGVLQWVKNQRPSAMIYTISPGFNLMLDNANNILVSASLNKTTSSSSTDFYIFKLNNAGLFQWDAYYNGPADDNDFVSSMALDQSGNAYVEGLGGNLMPYDKEITCVKFNGSTGAQQWVYRGNGTDGNVNNVAYNLSAGLSNDVYLTGSIYRNSDAGNDGVLIKLNAATGNESWKKFLFTENSSAPDMYNDVSVINSGVLYAVGFKYNSSNRVVATRKFNLAGDSLMAADYVQGSTYTLQPRCIIPGAGNSMLVAGEIKPSPNSRDVFMIKYDVTTGIEPVSNPSPDKFSLNQNYPNPFNPSTKISFNLQSNAKVTLEVFDAMGRKVSELTNSKSFTAGYHEINFDGSKLSSGIYFYNIEAEGFSETKKMLLVK